MNIGQRLKKIRKEKGIKMSAIEAATGIPADRMYKWEQGGNPQTAEDLRTIEAYLSKISENVPLVAPQQPQGGQQTSPAHDNGVTQEMTMRGILALVESNRALGIANQNLTESNLILSRELSGGLNKEIELVRELKNQIYVDMLFELGVGKGKRWKNKSEAVLELNNLLADALEVRGVGGKKLEAGSQRTG